MLIISIMEYFVYVIPFIIAPIVLSFFEIFLLEAISQKKSYKYLSLISISLTLILFALWMSVGIFEGDTNTLTVLFVITCFTVAAILLFLSRKNLSLSFIVLGTVNAFVGIFAFYIIGLGMLFSSL